MMSCARQEKSGQNYCVEHDFLSFSVALKTCVKTQRAVRLGRENPIIRKTAFSYTRYTQQIIDKLNATKAIALSLSEFIPTSVTFNY